MQRNSLPPMLVGLMLANFLFVPAPTFAANEALSPSYVVKSAVDAFRSANPDAVIRFNERTGLVASISGTLSGRSDALSHEAARAFLEQNSSLFGVATVDSELESQPTKETATGHFVYFTQKKNGIPVEGGKITIRVKDGIVRTVSNHLTHGISVETRPTIDQQAAVAIADTETKLTGLAPAVCLVILPWEDRVHLAFKIDYPTTRTQDPSRFRVYVDALNGKIIGMENRIMDVGPAVGSGIGVDGVSKTLSTYESAGQFYLGNYPIPSSQNITIKTYTANTSTTLPGLLVRDPNSDNTWTDPAAVDAHYYGNYVVNFYRNKFGNFSWFAGSGFNTSGGLVSTVHYDMAYDNAFWDGSQMVYGDGDVLFYPLSGALDVVAHEITHGVTEAITSLSYCKEPGALNESWSDVMGMFNAMEYGDSSAYLIGHTIMKIATKPNYQAYYALRRMDDPTFRSDAYPENDYNLADPLNNWGQPAHTSEKYVAGCWPWTDNGGVHINSGIPNKAAYLIVSNPAVGLAKAEQIYYQAMFYLTSDAQFTDGRNAVELATTDLYGSGAELAVVQQAFDTVGIY